MCLFGNNLEKTAFEKGEWHLVEENVNGNITTIYMGRSSNPDADDSDPVWLIKRVIISQKSNSLQTVETKYSQRRQAWSERNTVEYKYYWT